MPTDRAFRLSTYLALGLACLCVGYSEWDLLPEVSVFTGLVGILLVISYKTGPRFELGLAAANRLGLVIAILASVWIAYQFINKHSLIYTFPWPASLLPYVGALLMVLIPAKLFRPKHIGDWWTLQGMGMAATALASSMADDTIFAILLGLYIFVGLWSLTLFFYRRVAGELPPIPNTTPQPLATVVSGFSERSGRGFLLRTAGWLLLAVGICFPLFLVTPRNDNPRFQMGKGRLETGYNGDQMVDLNRTGVLQGNREVAYKVRAAYHDGTPKTDLSPNQRWRGVAFNQYDNGKWTRAEVGSLYARGVKGLPHVNATAEHPYITPIFEPDGYVLTYETQNNATDLVLADPVVWDVGRLVPAATFLPKQPVRPWFQNAEGSIRPYAVLKQTEITYQQSTRSIAAPRAVPSDPDLGPPFELRQDSAFALYYPNIPLADPAGAILTYRFLRLPRIRPWTEQLLARIASKNPEVKAALDRAQDRVSLRIRPDDYEVIARTLADHLASSGEYKYTTNLKRVDKASDPIEEFLFQSKEGHCQRFAAGLALMLRSVGIPANYVLGFRGCEQIAEGVYEIRQEFAHAWVEVLIPRGPPPGFERDPASGPPLPGHPNRVWHWLSLDPTPSDEFGGPSRSWFGAAQNRGAALFQEFIVGYSPERRERTLAAMLDWFREFWPWLVGLVLVLALAYTTRRVLRYRRAQLAEVEPTTGIPWFDDYRQVLDQFGFPIMRGQTPYEQAQLVAQFFAANPVTASVAPIPLRLTLAYYRLRYANQPPTESELTSLMAELERLRASPIPAPLTTGGTGHEAGSPDPVQ